MEKEAGVGTYLRYRLDHELFRRSTSNAELYRINECQFADDAALLATNRPGIEKAAQSYVEVALAFGLTVSIPKTKFLVTGHAVQESDKAPIDLSQGSIENVDEFPYLGSLVASNGMVDAEVTKRIANASRLLVPCVVPCSRTKTSPLPPSGRCTKHVCSLCSSMVQDVGHLFADI